jgi:Na+-translocating ferredoxin:NAD+ oxidoreductase RnfG subunit
MGTASRISLASLSVLLASSAVPIVAYSQVYLTEDQALQSMFPGEKFTRRMFDLNAEDVDLIEKKSGEKVRNKSIAVWTSSAKNVVLVDQVLGKHEFITYAVGLGPDKKIKAVEILEYRETYGYQVRDEPWRKQFVGKNAASPLELNKDIVNISGATLSSSHVTRGVKRLVQTYETIRERL